MEYERRTIELVECDHRTNEYHVIAALVAIGGATLEARRAPIEERDAARPALDYESGEFIGAACGKALRKIVLGRGKHVHSEMLRADKGR
jgi:hypothetical protein